MQDKCFTYCTSLSFLSLCNVVMLQPGVAHAWLWYSDTWLWCSWCFAFLNLCTHGCWKRRNHAHLIMAQYFSLRYTDCCESKGILSLMLMGIVFLAFVFIFLAAVLIRAFFSCESHKFVASGRGFSILGYWGSKIAVIRAWLMWVKLTAS